MIPASTVQKADGGLNVYPLRTIDDWLNRAPGGPAGDTNYGYFGPGTSVLNRADITGAGNTFVGSNFFTNTFGAKVWDSLNSQTRVFNLLSKVAWGSTTGYRIRSGRNSSTQPVAETNALPSIDSPTLQLIAVNPVFVVTSLGVSALAQFLGTLEGGIGDALAVAQETAMIDHTKRINQMLLASAYTRVTTGAASTTPSNVINSQYFNIGDQWLKNGDTATGPNHLQTVTAVSVANNTVTFTNSLQNTTTNDGMFVYQRAGMASIDDVVSQVGTVVANDTYTTQAAGYGGGTSAFGTQGGLTVTSRTAGNWNAPGYVGTSGNGTLRHLMTGMIDKAIDQVRKNAGEPDLIVTGVEQITRIGSILQANQHFIGEGTFQVKQGGEGTLMGYPTGFQASTYKGIPLFHDFDCAKSFQLIANGNAERGSHVYVLDTRYMEIPVLFTTQYLESRDYLQNNMLGIKGIFLTGLNLRVHDFVKQSVVRDLSDGSNIT